MARCRCGTPRSASSASSATGALRLRCARSVAPSPVRACTVFVGDMIEVSRNGDQGKLSRSCPNVVDSLCSMMRAGQLWRTSTSIPTRGQAKSAAALGWTKWSAGAALCVYYWPKIIGRSCPHVSLALWNRHVMLSCCSCCNQPRLRIDRSAYDVQSRIAPQGVSLAVGAAGATSPASVRPHGLQSEPAGRQAAVADDVQVRFRSSGAPVPRCLQLSDQVRDDHNAWDHFCDEAVRSGRVTVRPTHP